MNRIRNLLAQSAKEWGVPTHIATWIFGAPFVGAVLVAMARVNKATRQVMAKADEALVQAKG
jgi:hypothetical protein